MKKGQVTPIGITFIVIIFLVLWGLFFADFVTTWTQQAISANSLTGWEAFILSNLTVFIYIAAFIFVFAAFAFSSGR